MSEGEANLQALYDAALETGDAAALVKALCAEYGVNLRGLEALSGLPYSTLHRWSMARQHSMGRTLRELLPLVRPSKKMMKKIAKAKQEHRYVSTGRPPKR